MRPCALRLAMTTSLLAAACSVQTDDLTTSSIECTTNEDGTTTCNEGDDRPDDPGTPEGDLTCSGTGCVSQCEYGGSTFHCSITCENGLRCEQSCQEGNCEISCDCPDGGGGGGCDNDPTDECCREHPDDPACQPPCPDGSENCGCDDTTDPDCKPPCPDGSTDEECYCQQNPEDPACGGTECPPDDPECYCKDHPDDPHCTP